MSLPGGVLSVTPVLATYLSPDNRTRELLVDYEHGGIGLRDTSEGLMYQVWTLTYEGSDIIVTPDTTGSPETLFTVADITQASLAFDLNMNPFVTYVANNEAWYWWYDSTVERQVFTKMDADVTSPRCCLDDKRPVQSATADIILAYLRGTTLYMRVQRDRYGVEYELATGLTNGLWRVGMTENLRLKFEYGV